MIKNIEDLKNIQIVCREIEQAKNCLNYLKQLGFDIEVYTKKEYYRGYNIIFYRNDSKRFIISNMLDKNLIIEFYNKELVKTLQKFIKEEKEKEKKEEKAKDIKVASDGRIIKINNSISEKEIFICSSSEGDKIKELYPTWLEYVVKQGLAYATQEARDKAMFKLEIETKLKNIAERLNKGQKIDWEDVKQYKFHIYYDYRDKILKYFVRDISRVQGAIYCLDENFLNVAKQEIGEDNLIKYFKE